MEEASKGATDLTNLVKRKKPVESGTSQVNGNGKRKVDFAEETEEVGTGKKAKLENGDE